jgi:hypothetical protein
VGKKIVVDRFGDGDWEYILPPMKRRNLEWR